MSSRRVAYFETDEDDPFEAAEIHVRGPDGETFTVGEFPIDAGRYEVVRVDDD